MGEGPVLGAAAGSLGGKASLGTGAGYPGRVRGRGDQLQGAFASGRAVPPSPSVGAVHSAEHAWGSAACPSRAEEDAFQLFHFVCSLNDPINPQSHETNPLLSSLWPCWWKHAAIPPVPSQLAVIYVFQLGFSWKMNIKIMQGGSSQPDPQLGKLAALPNQL